MIREQLRRVDRRLLMVGAGLIGVLLGSVFLVTVSGGDGGNAETVPPPRPVPPVVGVQVPEKAAPVEAAPLLPSRDPFRQLASVPKAQASGQVPPSGPGPSPTVSAPPVAVPSTTPPVNASANASLELKSIVKDGTGVARATITVDGQSYTPAQGDVFSYGYRLERIDGNCVEVSAQGARAQMCVRPARP